MTRGHSVLEAFCPFAWGREPWVCTQSGCTETNEGETSDRAVPLQG